MNLSRCIIRVIYTSVYSACLEKVHRRASEAHRNSGVRVKDASAQARVRINHRSAEADSVGHPVVADHTPPPTSPVGFLP